MVIIHCGRPMRCVFTNNIIRRYCSNRETRWPERIFSGIQPSGMLHIGNYFGAIENWVKIQNEGRSAIYSIVDLHSITTPYDISKLPENILLMAATIVGCGIDPEKSILFVQSEVPYHTSLNWVLSCLTTNPQLSRQPQYKEKIETMNHELLGVYLYPVLQAADILLYKATLIPVGEDQLQHIYFANDVAHKFNVIYGETFPRPKPFVRGDGKSRLRSLRYPTKKMSKSDGNPKGRIDILDSPDTIARKIKKAVTDCTSAVTYDPVNRPGVSNLITIHSLCTGYTPQKLCDEAISIDTARYKLVVTEAVVETLKPIQKRINYLWNNKEHLEKILKTGAESAMTIASTTWTEVINKIGTHYSISHAVKKSNS